jgi:hypothetical protein
MTIQIGYSSANDGQWGADTTPEQARTLAENCTNLATAYAAKLWPRAAINGSRRDHPVLSAVTAYDRDGMDAEEVKAQIEEYISHHWVEEPLWQDSFDEHAYLAANPS